MEYKTNDKDILYEITEFCIVNKIIIVESS